MTTEETPTVEPLVYTKAQLPHVVGLGKATIDKMRSEGKFPQPVVLGGRKVGWPCSVILEWLAQRPVATGLR